MVADYRTRLRDPLLLFLAHLLNSLSFVIPGFTRFFITRSSASSDLKPTRPEILQICTFYPFRWQARQELHRLRSTGKGFRGTEEVFVTIIRCFISKGAAKLSGHQQRVMQFLLYSPETPLISANSKVADLITRILAP